jgi:hypothetical protein
LGLFFLGATEGVFCVTLCSNRGYGDFGVFEIGFVLRTFGMFFGPLGSFLTRIDTNLHEKGFFVTPILGGLGGLGGLPY